MVIIKRLIKKKYLQTIMVYITATVIIHVIN